MDAETLTTRLSVVKGQNSSGLFLLRYQTLSEEINSPMYLRVRWSKVSGNDVCYLGFPGASRAWGSVMLTNDENRVFSLSISSPLG